MNRHHIDADPDPDPDPTLSLWTFIHTNASLHCFILLIRSVIIFSILDSILKFSGEKSSLSLHLVEIDTDPDPDRLARDADPDPAK